MYRSSSAGSICSGQERLQEQVGKQTHIHTKGQYPVPRSEDNDDSRLSEPTQQPAMMIFCLTSESVSENDLVYGSNCRGIYRSSISAKSHCAGYERICGQAGGKQGYLRRSVTGP